MARSFRRGRRVSDPQRTDQQRHTDPKPDPQLAFVFPGQGSQSLGMLSELAQEHAIIAEVFAEASDGAGTDLWTLSQSGPDDRLNQTEFTQPALLAAGVATWRLWQARGGATPARLVSPSVDRIPTRL